MSTTTHVFVEKYEKYLFTCPKVCLLKLWLMSLSRNEKNIYLGTALSQVDTSHLSSRYSRTSIARTLTAGLPWLIQTHF